jgi:ankyrin repeat protein
MRTHLTKLAIPRLLLVLLVGSCNRQHLDSKILDKQMLEAARQGDTASVQQLFRKGASIHAKSENGETALTLAASGGNGPLVAWLLDGGISAEEKNEALFSAVRFRPAVVEYLKDANPMPGPIPPQYAVGGDYVLNLLLSKGANVEARDEQGETPLIAAASHGGTNAVKMFLERGANPNARDNTGVTALIAAACVCAVIDMPDTANAMKLLLDNGAEIDAKTPEGYTALMSAAGAGRTNIVKLLLDRGALIEGKDATGETALMVAASGSAYPTIETTKLLLDKGGNIEARDAGGKTPLVLAASGNGFDRFPTVKRLLERGANVRAKDKHGDTALSLAKKNNQQDVQRDHDKLVELLSNAMSASH